MSTENKKETEDIEQQIPSDAVSTGENGKREEIENPRAGNDPGAAWAAENAEATGAHSAEDMQSAGIPGRILIIIAACLVIAIALWFYLAKKPEQPSEEAQTGISETQEQAQTAETAQAADTGETASISSTASTSSETALVLSPEMETLDKKLRKELAEKAGDWSLYLYRLDTGEEIGVNANDPMISASLIKLYVAGCYLEQVEKGTVEDNYQQQLFAMLSASDNGATNQLIDLLGMDRINAFIKDHNYPAGQLNRKMLENNGTENYTSAKDCGRVLRSVCKGTYVNKEASKRVLEAMRAQIARNRYKIPAGLPEDVETANKTGELFTKNKEGVNVSVQNDAAIIFVEDHPYVLTVMTAVPGAGEGELHRQIADLSREVYEAVCGVEEQTEEGTTAGTQTEAAQAEEGTTAGTQTEAAQAEESAAGETQAQDSNTADPKQENSRTEDTKQENSRTGDTKQGNSKTEDKQKKEKGQKKSGKSGSKKQKEDRSKSGQ